MEALVKKLRAGHIAVTPQRLAVLGNLKNRRDHPTAEDIYREVRLHLPAISFNTVYKILEVFCRKGLALKVNPLHEVAHYDGEIMEHAHLICRRCHHIVDLAWRAAPALPLSGMDLQGFQVEHQSLVLWGLCPQCQDKEIPEEK
jgi:Fur family peroxide stress response transcriptional regulator